MKTTDVLLLGLGAYFAWKVIKQRRGDTAADLGLTPDDFGRTVTIDGITGILV